MKMGHNKGYSKSKSTRVEVRIAVNMNDIDYDKVWLIVGRVIYQGLL